MQTLLNGLLVMGLALVVLAGLVVFGMARQLRTLRWRRVRSRTLPRDEIPEDTRRVLDQAAAMLQSAGFVYRYSGATERTVAPRGGAGWGFSDVYQQADGPVHAVVIPSATPERHSPCVIQLISCFADGSNLCSFNAYRHHIPLNLPGWTMFDDYLPDFSPVFALHQQRTQARQSASSALPLVDGLAVRQRLRDSADAVMTEMLRLRRLTPLDKPERWQLTWPAAIGLVFRQLRGQWRVSRAASRIAAAPLPAVTGSDALAAGDVGQTTLQADLQAFARQQALLKTAAWGSRKKLLVFLLTASLFLLVGGFFLSWTFVPVLLAVVALHEGGHYLAMRLTGYQNVSVFFLPGLGGLATGEKAHATPFEKLFVFLAGPMPGLVLAVAALLLMNAGLFSPPAWFTGFLIACLLINYLNLLPITPLDGGRVVEIFMFARFPVLRFGFAALSCALLFGLGLLFGDPVLQVIALLLLLGLPHQWRLMLANRALQRSSDAALAEPAALELIFSSLQAPQFGRWSFARRMSVARAMLPELLGQRASVNKAVAGMLIYSVCLFGPLAAALVAMPQLGSLAGMMWFSASLEKDDVDDDTTSRPPATAEPDWEAQLAQLAQRASPNPDEVLTARLGAARQAGNSEDSDKARSHYLEAWKIAQTRPQTDAQRLETLLELARFSDSSQEARSYLQTVITDLAAPQGSKQWLQLAEAREELARLDTPLAEQLALLREAVAHRLAYGKPDAHELLQTRLDLARTLDNSGDAAGAETVLRSRLNGIPAPDPASRTRQALEQRLQRAQASTDLAWFLMDHKRAPEARNITTTALQDVPQKVSVSWLYPNQMLLEALLWAHLALRDEAAVRQGWSNLEAARSQASMGQLGHHKARPQLTHEADRALVAQMLGDSRLAAQARSGLLESAAFFKKQNRPPPLCETPDATGATYVHWPQWRKSQRDARLLALKQAGVCG